MLLLTLGAKAQDTIWDASLGGSNYLITEDNWAASDTGVVGSGGSRCKLFGKPFFVGDSALRVYGIAAMLAKPDLGADFNSHVSDYIVDTSLDKACEFVAIHTAGPDSLTQISEKMSIHCKNTVPAYYLGTNMYNPYKEYRERKIHAVYEVFFKEPVDVTDSFYVTMTRDSWRDLDGVDAPADTDTLHRVWSAWPIGPVTYGAYYTDSAYCLHALHWERALRIGISGEYFYIQYPGNVFLFPILTPEEVVVDTTIVDTTIVDTVGIGMVRLLERYVGLQPNPASERVLVTSSFGLRRLEVYNAAGAKVAEQPATGYSATLDVAALPEGSYLVRIATPSGSVTKKLLIRRR